MRYRRDQSEFDRAVPFVDATFALAGRGGVRGCCDEDFEPVAAALEGAFQGRAGVREFMAGLAEVYELVRIDPEDVRDVGERVLGLGTMTTVAKGSGIEQKTPIAFVVYHREGLVVHFKDYGDANRALEAVRLSE